MGHYDDAREAHEDRLHDEAAKRKGITPNELYQLNKHNQQMSAGRMAYEKQLREQKDIAYYLKHK